MKSSHSGSSVDKKHTVWYTFLIVKTVLLNLKNYIEMKKSFSKFFTNYGKKSAINELLEFLNKYNLAPQDYHLIAQSNGLNLETGENLGVNITCIYYANNELP